MQGRMQLKIDPLNAWFVINLNALWLSIVSDAIGVLLLIHIPFLKFIYWIAEPQGS